MSLIIKHTFKSMWAHKLRTFILLFCITVCSFAAMMSFDMAGTLESAIRSATAALIGSSDIEVSANYDLQSDFTKGLPENTVLPLRVSTTSFTKHMEGTYDILVKKDATVFGMDVKAAKDMKVIPADADLEGLNAAIGKPIAREFGYEVGDTIALYNDSDEPMEFTVSGIYGMDGGILSAGNGIAVSEESLEKLYGGELPGIRTAYIDIHDNSKIDESVELLKKNNPSAEVETVFSEDEEAAVQNVMRVFIVLFVVCLMLVIFVTISSSQRIITEKMPVIGTFRSLGISTRLTYSMLLGENAAYGLIGALAGIAVYKAVRLPILESLFVIDSTNGEAVQLDFGSIKITTAVIIVICSILLECLCPLKEILLAVKTSIRDIIFSNKDTQYRHGRVSTAVGIAFGVISAVTAFFSFSFLPGMICFISAAIGAALLFPYVLRFLAGLLVKAFDKSNKPIARLAAVEVREKKSTVGSSVLCFTAAAVCIVVYAFAVSLGDFYSHEEYKGDVVVECTYETEKARFSYIPDLTGVEQTEYIYLQYDKVMIDGKMVSSADMTIMVIYGWKDGGYKLYDGITGVPDDIKKDELVITQSFAETLGVKDSQKVKFTFQAEGFIPREKDLTVRVADVIDQSGGSTSFFVVHEDLIKEIYHDYPTYIVTKCTDPEGVRDTIKTHSADMVSQVRTIDEVREDQQTSIASIMMVIRAIIIIAAGMTFIGVTGNRLIGFEGRKRECAVLSSVAMTRRQLSLMLFEESLFASFISLAVSVPLAMYMYRVFMKILSGLELSIPVTLEIGSYIRLAVILCAVFTMSAIFTIRALRKMELAAQLKYE